MGSLVTVISILVKSWVVQVELWASTNHLFIRPCNCSSNIEWYRNRNLEVHWQYRTNSTLNISHGHTTHCYSCLSSMTYETELWLFYYMTRRRGTTYHCVIGSSSYLQVDLLTRIIFNYKKFWNTVSKIEDVKSQFTRLIEFSHLHYKQLQHVDWLNDYTMFNTA